MTRLLALVDRERSPTTSGTVGYLLCRWLEVADLELTTRDGYEGYSRRNILPAPGGRPVAQAGHRDARSLLRPPPGPRGRCRVCWDRAQHRLPSLSAGERYRPKPNADEITHGPDCASGMPTVPRRPAAQRQRKQLEARRLRASELFATGVRGPRSPASSVSPPRP
jgi:hypothetical protein